MQSCHSMTGEKGLEPVKTELRLEDPYGILKNRESGRGKWQLLQVGTTAMELKNRTFLVLALDDEWLRPKEFELEKTKDVAVADMERCLWQKTRREVYTRRRRI